VSPHGELGLDRVDRVVEQQVDRLVQQHVERLIEPDPD
jgi:hypothetical protein